MDANLFSILSPHLPIKIDLTTDKQKAIFSDLQSSLIAELNPTKNQLFLKKDFFDGRLIKNVWRFNLIRTGGAWVLKEHLKADENLVSEKNQFKDKNITEDVNNILIIMESPHREEYDDDYNPIGPAIGETGKNIRDYLHKAVIPILEEQGLKIPKNKRYKICLMNPVPYQTSLYLIRKRMKPNEENLGTEPEIRNKVWRKLFNILEEEFKKTIEKSKAEIIICACTSGLDKRVEAFFATNFRTLELYSTPHPSTWDKLSGFNKI